MLKPQEFGWENYPHNEKFSAGLAKYLFRQTVMYSESAIEDFLREAESVNTKDVINTGKALPLLKAISYPERKSYCIQDPPGIISTILRRRKEIKEKIEDLRKYRVQYWLSKDAYFRLKDLLEESLAEQGFKCALEQITGWEGFGRKYIYQARTFSGILKVNSEFDHGSLLYAQPSFEISASEHVDLEEVLRDSKKFIQSKWNKHGEKIK